MPWTSICECRPYLEGDGQGTNPEQLFAAGFSACYHGALSLVARQEEVAPSAISVEATVGS
ncbi:OsmC family protein [Streptomyces canus]|uniref:OsmC family protein n=1 Tax=Streptomyces canus TaxID=58343 RepID=UPI002E31EDAD|nr:OsmC family protein [Streptomyces canus]